MQPFGGNADVVCGEGHAGTGEKEDAGR